MLLTSYFVPHSPVLIPRIGKDHINSLKKTIKSYSHIKNSLKTLNPDTLIVLSAHSPDNIQTIALNLSQEYKMDLKEFGDLTTRQTWRPDIKTINHIAFEGSTLYDINLISQEVLDYGTSIPLHLLTENIPAVKIVPITYPEISLPEMHRFGVFLEKVIATLNRRFVILATGDLSHKLTEDSASGYSEKGSAFDTQLLEAIENRNIKSLLTIDQPTLNEVGQCGLRALLALWGAMQNKNTQPMVLAYENDLGVGYLSLEFRLP